MGVGAPVALALVGVVAWSAVGRDAPPSAGPVLEDRFVVQFEERQAPGGARREEGVVGRKDERLEEARGNRIESKRLEIHRQVAENAGVLGASDDRTEVVWGVGDGEAQGGLAGRGGGLGGGGTALGIGSFGAKGEASGAVGYGSGGGSHAARASRTAAPVAQDAVHYGYNPTELVQRDGLSTFSIDVDTASYTQARRSLIGGVLPTQAAVRTEEFVNYGRYRYPQPEPGAPFSITMDAARHPWEPQHHVIRVGIKGADGDQERVPLHLTFLVDTSGSMAGGDRLPLAKRSLEYLVGNLAPGDTVAIATYAGSTQKVLEPTPVSDAPRIVEAIRSLTSGGGTRMGSGLELAYEMASRARVQGHENRVIVLSDGDANLGATSHEQMLASLADHAKQGITLSTVGFGRGNYRDTLMEQLADQGDGNASYIDDFEEAKRVFGEDLGATLTTIARDVKIQVQFDLDDVIAYKLVGYENRAIADQDFRNDHVDAGEVGAGHTVTALYDVVLRDERSGPIAWVRVRHKAPGPDVPATEQVVELPASAVGDAFDEADRDLQRAWGSAAFAEKLRGAPSMVEVGWARIEALVAGAMRPEDDRDVELLDLVRRARWLSGEAPSSAVVVR